MCQMRATRTVLSMTLCAGALRVLAVAGNGLHGLFDAVLPHLHLPGGVLLSHPHLLALHPHILSHTPPHLLALRPPTLLLLPRCTFGRHSNPPKANCVTRAVCIVLACFGVIALFSGLYSNILIAINGTSGGGGHGGGNATNATTLASAWP